MFGVTIGEKHSVRDFGLVMTEKVISPPVPKVKKVDVPMRDGAVDLTHALSDEVMFENRMLLLTFAVTDPVHTWAAKISEIENYLHGKNMQIIFDDDKAFYYYGRVSVNKWTSNCTIGTLVLECDVDPYKYDLLPSDVDWEWDIFDFENGIINEMGELIVNGNITVTLICRRKRMYPTITASTPLIMEYKGESYRLVPGSQKFYDLFLCEGENVLTFKGHGTVSINYIGGSL